MTALLRTFLESTLYENLDSEEFHVGLNTLYDANDNTIDIANVVLRIDIGEYKSGFLISKMIIDVDEYSIGILGHNVSHTIINFYNFKFSTNIENSNVLTMKIEIPSDKPFYSCTSGESCVNYTDEEILIKYGYVEQVKPKKVIKVRKKISRSTMKKLQKPITVPANIYDKITNSPCSKRTSDNDVEYEYDEEFQQFDDINETQIS